MNIPRALELRHLRHFVTLAEELHFSRAAARVGMAQPPFSQSIAKLEAVIGTRLFERRRAGPERVQLTEAGRALFDRVRYVLGDLAGAVEVTRAAGRGEAGQLRVGFVASLANGPLPHYLAAFAAKFPEVRLSLSEMTTDPMLDALQRRELDLGIGRELAEAPGLVVERLFAEPMHLIAASGSALAKRRRVEPQDVRHEPFILPPARAGEGLHAHIRQLCAAAGIVPNVRQEATEWATIIGLVAAGFGMSIVPASAISPHHRVKIVSMAAAQAWQTSVFACWPAILQSATRDNLMATLRAGWQY